MKNLMSGSKAGADVPEDEPVEDPDAPKEVLPIISYFHPNVTLEMVPASGPIPWGTLPQPLQDRASPSSNPSSATTDPDFWQSSNSRTRAS